METVTITFNISKERLLDTMKMVGGGFGLELKRNIDLNQLAKQFSEDVENYISDDLSNFVDEGLNNDLYSDFFDEKEDED